MQTERPVMPELDRQREEAIAGPIRRAWNRSHRVFRGVERDRLLEGVAALERRRLLAGPGADLGKAGPGGEVGIGLLVVDSRDRAAQPHLPVQRFPMEEERAFAAGVELVPLLAIDIGVEHEATLVEAFHQYHANVGSSVGIDGGERHGSRIAWLAFYRLLEPGREQPQRLVRLGEITG